MNVLVVGGGGREHAIVWALKSSKRVSRIFVAPGNAGTAQIAENLPIEVDDIKELVLNCLEQQIKFVVVGPEVPLALGLVDTLAKVGVRAFGPSQAAAQLEASKAFAKDAMLEFGIPTAAFGVFDSLESALGYVRSRPFQTQGFVVKADGLAAGKGVSVCDTADEATAALEACFSGAFGEAGARVVIEERLLGRELSVLAFSDGKTVKPMIAARDHKRALDGDLGANTGGMGAFAPAPDITPEFLSTITKTILEPTVKGMAARGTAYKGVLYAGLMLTKEGIKVIEFNCRFGDPEAQVVLPLLETDLFDVLDACVAGTLDAYKLTWKPGFCATVVMASGGYPERSESGKPITGLGAMPKGVTVFHAATKLLEDGGVVTNGGRVLNVTANGDTLELALEKAYIGVSRIAFEGMQFRTDIGSSTLSFAESEENAERGAQRAERQDQSANENEASKAGVGATGRSPLQADAYASAGVNIAEGARAVALMKDAVRSTHDPRVLAGVGAFGGMLDISSLKSLERPVLVASTDGVGTKTTIAAQLNSWDGIGADIVNHGINDILAQGAKPLFFMDYVAASTLKAEWVASVVSGMARACKAAGCVLLGGETAEMPGVYRDGESDVVGTMVGVVEFAHAITGARVQPGDALIAFPSSGLHTNGYTLARKALADLDWNEPQADLNGESIGAALLEPHRSYLNHVLELQSAGVDVRALAHITGGGLWDNLPRALPDSVMAAVKRGSWTAPPIFKLITSSGTISERDAFHAFNMGLGMIAVIPAGHVALALETLPQECFVIGEIRALEGERVVLE